jgi:hypothetical protein
VDGVDCPIYEPQNFDPKWWSHKFNGPALRYELGINILSSDLCWLNGPFIPGPNNDWLIFRDGGLMDNLNCGETVVADSVYHWPAETPNGLNNNLQRLQSLARSRHENFNKRIKAWKCLSHPWRHKRSLHSLAFRAVAIINHLETKYARPLFPVDYDDSEE